MRRECGPLDRRVVHMAHKVTDGGDVSALCYPRDKPIDLTLAVWTIRPIAVTCLACRRRMRAGQGVR